MKNFLWIPAFIAACLLAGVISAQFQADALAHWYPALNKSALTPPAAVFPIVWTIIYILMGTSGGIVAASKGIGYRSLLSVFWMQLFFNFWWSILFFYLRSPAIALLDALTIQILALTYAFRAWPRFRLASLLFVPYILWLAFAIYLNAYVAIFN